RGAAALRAAVLVPAWRGRGSPPAVLVRAAAARELAAGRGNGRLPELRGRVRPDGIPGRGRCDGMAALPQRRPAEPAAVRRSGGRLRAAGRRTDPAHRHAGQPDALDRAAAGQGAAVAPDLAALAELRVAGRRRGGGAPGAAPAPRLRGLA